jgi:YidC/Oxa1 family membrane protein insertase
MSSDGEGLSFQQRVFLTVFLCLGIWLAFDLLSPPPPAPEVDDAAPVTEGEAPGPVGPEPAPAPANPPAVEIVEHRLHNDLVALEVTNAGSGLIRRTELLGSQFREPDGRGLDFLYLAGPGALDLGFDPNATDFAWAPGTVREVLERTDRRFVVRQVIGAVEIRETLELLDGYEARYDVTVTNRGANAVRRRAVVRTRMGPAVEESQYDIHRALCRTTDDVEEFEVDDVEDGPQRIGSGVAWVAVGSQYFVHVVAPLAGDQACEVDVDVQDQALVVGVAEAGATVAAGGAETLSFAMYLGAKNQHRLAGFSLVQGAGLEDTIDWGWFGGMSRFLGGLLFDLLHWLNSLTGIWGVAIVILTAIVKIVTLPLTLKQMSSMRRMRDIQPEMEKIRTKYAEDRTKQSQEMQALFQRTGVNPLAGCLPMLVQMPVWFALYSMLSAVVELYHEPFLWLPDLTKPDPWFILPLAMGGLMFLQARIQPTAVDNQQAKMMQWMMPIIFTVMMLFLPSGLGVYIFANIVLSLVQTWVQLRPGKKPPAAATASVS